jgi:hypothetical protein
MAIQSNFPNIQPSLNLSFAQTKALDSRITFTRASEGRFYDGRTFSKAEENLLVRSQDFTTTWTTSQASVVSNSTAAPDGTTTAATLSALASTNIHLVGQAIAGSASTRVLSVFVKKHTHDFIQLCVATDAASFANFNLATGVVGTAGVSVTSAIQDAGNGWYRCSMTFASAAATTVEVAIVSSASAVRRESWAATGLESVYLWGAQLEQRSSVTAYTPTTTQPITNYILVLQTAAANVARFDHNPVTGESLGLLIEESRSNLVLQSEDFTTTWAATRATIGANSVVAPTGALTADRLIDTTDNNTHFVSQSVITTAVAMTFSVHAKASGRSFVYLSINDSGNVARTTFFNLSTGAVGTTGTGITASIVPVGNGWYRCIVTVATAFAGSNPCAIGVASADNTASYAGNGFDGVAIWGAQVE